MILLLDCGNTRIKYAWFDGQQRTSAAIVTYEQIQHLPYLLEYNPAQIFAVSVTQPAIQDNLNQLAQQHWGIQINWCNTRSGRNYLSSNYANSLGADRWFAMLGLLSLVQHQQDWQQGITHILASFGTATTIDAIQYQNHQASFLGGLILPGFDMMRNSLAHGTAQLPLASGQTTAFPLNTDSAIYSGIIAAQSGALIRQWQHANQASQAAKIYVCGGAWHSIQQPIMNELKHIAAQTNCTYLDYPVLDGLALVAASS